MVFQIFCGYLALAATFYSGMMLTATERVVPAYSHRHTWHRAHRIMNNSFRRRMRPLLALRAPRLPKRSR